MNWILLALLAHGFNAIVFVVDKGLLVGSSVVASPLRYTFFSALLAGVAIVALPFGYQPLTNFIVIWSVIAGLLHIGALWMFFSALSHGEPSRVVPLTGSTVALSTLLLATMFLGEVFSFWQAMGVLLFLLGGIFLSIQIKRSYTFSFRLAYQILLAGVLFASSFASVKYLYDGSDTFLATFVYSRVIESLCALVFLGPFLMGVQSVKSSARVSMAMLFSWSSLVFVGNKALAASAFALQNYAIALGSVAVVNALQGFQYVFLLLLAWGVSHFSPRFFKEEFSRVSLVQKILGVVSVGIGLLLFSV